MCGIRYLKCPHVPKGAYMTDSNGRELFTESFDVGRKKVPKHFTVRTLHEDNSVSYKKLPNPDYGTGERSYRQVKYCEDCKKELKAGNTIVASDGRMTKTISAKQRRR